MTTSLIIAIILLAGSLTSLCFFIAGADAAANDEAALWDAAQSDHHLADLLRERD